MPRALVDVTNVESSTKLRSRRRNALIKNKRAAGRPQDIADVKALGDV
jgi:hypothetical protein